MSLFSLGAAYTSSRGLEAAARVGLPDRLAERVDAVERAVTDARRQPGRPAGNARRRVMRRQAGQRLRGLLHQRDVGAHLLDEQVALADGARPVAASAASVMPGSVIAA